MNGKKSIKVKTERVFNIFAFFIKRLFKLLSDQNMEAGKEGVMTDFSGNYLLGILAVCQVRSL